MPASRRPIVPASASSGRIVGMVSTYPPRLCGLATFAAALEAALLAAGDAVTVVTVADGPPTGSTDRASTLVLHPGDARSMQAAAAELSDCDAVIIQHEYGIYGGVDGDEVIALLGQIHAPTIVVLHTVPAAPTPHQRAVLESVAEHASVLVVMTDSAAGRLQVGFAVSQEKVVTIPHGAWSLRTTGLAAVASPEQPLQVLTWGLLGPGKGIEHAIRALGLLGSGPRPVRYTVAGATHPNVLARDGEEYRDSLIALAQSSDLGADVSVRFDGGYRNVDSLGRLVAACDLVLLPYDSHDQVTSGVLVDAVAAGKPVIATAFPHAVEVLSAGAGVVVAHGDVAALAGAIRDARNEPWALTAMAARARELAPRLAWASVAERYRELCDQLLRSGSAAAV